MTTPGITNALRAFARHNHESSPRHWMALLQVATYVNATKGINLRFVCGSGLRLLVYAYTDHATASNDRRCASGGIAMLGNTVIGSKSSTQKCVITTPCELEYVTLCNVFKVALLKEQHADVLMKALCWRQKFVVHRAALITF